MKSEHSPKAARSRRDFVRQFGEAAIVSGLVSSGFSAASYDRILGANDRIVMGLIGCGGRGQDVMREFLGLGVEFDGVCDPDASRMAEAQQLTNKKAQVTRDFRHLLEEKNIDAVIVATPDHWHALPTILACEAGKD